MWLQRYGGLVLLLPAIVLVLAGQPSVVMAQSVTSLKFDPVNVRLGGSFAATFSGTDVADTYFDVRFRSPESNEDRIALNWQRGASSEHSMPADIASGTWIVTGVWPHQDAEAHSSNFLAVSASLTALPLCQGDFGSFTRIGSMKSARQFNGAVLLPKGSVLIGAAELYDPDTCTFTTVGNFSPLATNSTTTLLGDGRVLIIGVDQVTGMNASALYDPATQTVTSSGGTVTGQIGGWATLLHNGKVLVAGGMTRVLGGLVQIANPEVYDPSTGTFTATGAFATTGSPFYVAGGPAVSAVSLLADGRVLFAGEPTSELYDPQTGRFSLTGSMTTASFPLGRPGYIYGRTATLLPDGKVLLTGGEHEDLGRFADAELYDPATETFTPTGKMAAPRDNHTATLLTDGTVLVAGGESMACDGRGFCIFSGTTSSAESYDPSTGTFTAVGNMTASRGGQMATLLRNGTVLIAGGYSYGGIGLYFGATNSAELYVPRVVRPASLVTDLQFDPTTIPAGGSYSVNVSGSNLTSQTFFDVRFHAPGSTLVQEGLNWQRGLSGSHIVPPGTAAGAWTITGVRAHELETDHTGSYVEVSASITVSQ